MFFDWPNNLSARALTSSTYKNHNNAKFFKEQFVSFQRNGEIGRVTSLLLKIRIPEICSIWGVIMAGRGFSIAETLGTFGAKFKIPSFTKVQKSVTTRGS